MNTYSTHMDVVVTDVRPVTSQVTVVAEGAAEQWNPP